MNLRFNRKLLKNLIKVFIQLYTDEYYSNISDDAENNFDLGKINQID